MYGKFHATNAQAHVKRAHKKSRSGCVTCKQRRVKCDEARPICDRCRARGLDCSYQGWIPKNQVTVNESESSTCSNETPNEAFEVDVDGLDVSETELAHHYLSHTSRTLATTSSADTTNHSWCVVVPALAVTSRAVRSGMLSLAACCMYSHAAPDAGGGRAALLKAAYSHYHACLRESGQQLTKLHEAEQMEPIVATTRILFALGLAFCQIERRLGKTLADPEYWTWLPLLRGNATVMPIVEHAGMREALLQGADMVPEMIPRLPYASRTLNPPNDVEPPALLAFLRTARTSSLFCLREALERNRRNISIETHDQYSQSIDLLDEVGLYLCTFPRIHSFVRVIFVWPGAIPTEFAEALSTGDRFAWIIYAHWLMLTVLLEDLWLVGEMGRTGIFEIVARSVAWSNAEQVLLSWPRRLLSRATLAQ